MACEQYLCVMDNLGRRSRFEDRRKDLICIQ